MWIKAVDGSYRNLDSANTLSLVLSGTKWRIYLNGGGAYLAEFSTQETAQTALDAFMNEVGHEVIISEGV